MESKWNETFRSMIFGTNVIQRTWSGSQATTEAATRVEAPPTGCAPLSRGPLGHPPTYFFLLYIPTYPEKIRTDHENLIPPPQPSVSARSHLGAFADVLPEGESTTEGFYINILDLPMSCE